MADLQTLYSNLTTLGLPVAYHHFDTAPTLPFIAYYRDEEKLIVADNTKFGTTISVTVELYTEKIDLETENLLEAILLGLNLIYSKVTTWIDAEQMFMTRYEMELI